MQEREVLSVKEFYSGKFACEWVVNKDKKEVQKHRSNAVLSVRSKLWSAFVPEGALPSDYFEFQVGHAR